MTRFTVRKLGWHQAPHGDSYTRRLPSAEPVAYFDNFDEAEYHRRSLEHETRSRENPFRFGGAAVFFQSSLDAPRLHDWLLDEGIDPPVEQLRHTDWLAWWGAFAHTWTESQLAHAWQGLDKVRFFDVIEEPATDPFYVLLEVQFNLRSSHVPEADREGGIPDRVFRHSRTATAACNRQNQAIRDGTVRREHDWFDHGPRQGYEGERFVRDIRRAVFFEVVRIPGELPPHTPVGYLVQRIGFDAGGHICHNPQNRATGSRVPVRLFADRESANAHRDELFVAAREVLNPFQVYTPQLGGLHGTAFLEVIAELRPPLPWPPNLHPSAWREWWDLCQDELSPEQRHHGWELFSQHPLFEVLPVSLGD